MNVPAPRIELLSPNSRDDAVVSEIILMLEYSSNYVRDSLEHASRAVWETGG